MRLGYTAVVQAVESRPAGQQEGEHGDGEHTMFVSIRRGEKCSADEEPGGAGTGLVRRLGTQSLGVGVANGSDWKGKLQEGSGRAR